MLINMFIAAKHVTPLQSAMCFLPPAYEVRGKVMFSLLSVQRAGRGYPGQDKVPPALSPGQDRVPLTLPLPSQDPCLPLDTGRPVPRSVKSRIVIMDF